MEATIRALGEEWVFAGLISLGLFALYVLALDQGFLLRSEERRVGKECRL